MNQSSWTRHTLVPALAGMAALMSLSLPSAAQQQIEIAPDEPRAVSPGWPPAEVVVKYPLPGKDFVQKSVDVDGWHINYMEAGKGPVVLVAFSGSMGMAPSTAKDMLAKEIRVIEINPPGWGGDELNTKPRDMKDMAMVFLHVLDKIGVQKFHALGISMGCTHALWAAEFAPDRVQSVTVEGGQCMAIGPGPNTQRTQTPRQIAAQKAAQAGGAFDDDYTIWAGWPGYHWAPAMWWQTPSYEGRAMYRRYVKNFPYNHNDHREEWLAGLKNVKVPTTEMVGDRDEVMTTGVSYYWKKNMPQARVAVVAGSIHDIEDSQPEQFVELIKACSLDPSPSKLRCPAD